MYHTDSRKFHQSKRSMSRNLHAPRTCLSITKNKTWSGILDINLINYLQHIKINVSLTQVRISLSPQAMLRKDTIEDMKICPTRTARGSMRKNRRQKGQVYHERARYFCRQQHSNQATTPPPPPSCKTVKNYLITPASREDNKKIRSQSYFSQNKQTVFRCMQGFL